jgi:hypothetical protein
MSLGLLLIFIGTQLYFVETYELTPRVTKLIKRKGGGNTGDVYEAAGDAYQTTENYYSGDNNYLTAGYSDSLSGTPVGPNKTISPPNWICWPVFFLGAVLFLHALVLPNKGSH